MYIPSEEKKDLENRNRLWIMLGAGGVAVAIAVAVIVVVALNLTSGSEATPAVAEEFPPYAHILGAGGARRLRWSNSATSSECIAVISPSG